MASAVRLPGIQFDVVTPPATPALVRMDIAAFVGFAASGPIGTPVAVESIVDFEEIFGDDLILAADPVSNQPLYAYLAPAARAFFRNGGQRCWVVRVADSGAISDTFPIDGLYALGDGGLAPVFARARSEGSWADDLTAGISLSSQAILATGFSQDPYTVGLTLQAPGEVGAGDLLRLTFTDTADVLWLFVDSIAPAAGASPLAPVQPGSLVTATGATGYWEQLLSPPAPGSAPAWLPLASPPGTGTLPVCELITMDLFAESGSGGIWTLTGLGFSPAHPRYFGNLPDDATLYAMDNPAGLALDAAHPRFPLAGPADGTYFVPADAGPLPVFKPAQAPPADAIVRNGVATFGSDLFLDPALAGTSALDLMQEADYIRYQSIAPRPLQGIHAALAVEEAAIIAAPDAVQRGWFPVASAALASPPASSPIAHPEWWHFLDCRQQNPVPLTSGPPAGQFQPCNLEIVAAPALTLVPPQGGLYSLQWTPQAGAVDYLEEATDAGFSTAGVIYQGSSGSVTIYGHPPGDYYYRLRRQVGEFSSDYSNGVGLSIEPTAGWQINPASAYRNQPLLDVHSALLRMCAARGDLFAVLGLPAHYRERDAMAHTAQLKAALGAAEQAAYSYGALYHPWLTGREENDLNDLRSNPPDGAACGIIAFRSSSRGPWISPANEPLHGVAALAPAAARSYWQALQNAQVNLLRQEPGGFLCLSASTLSDNPDLEPINVRRLMSFLRKTVLRAGVDYVFEPNSDDFRRGVERGFEKVLDMLFLRGAFAGRTASEGYQVATDARVNTPATIARGEFFVEIRVAPSVPMRFLTVRLVQTADTTFVTGGS
jgi:hypothetical protein